MFQTCRISWQDVTRSDKYSELSYVVFSWSCTLIPRRLRARHHISAKNTFCTLCAGAHKVQEIYQPGSEGGARLVLRPHPYHAVVTPVLMHARTRYRGARSCLSRLPSRATRAHALPRQGGIAARSAA